MLTFSYKSTPVLYYLFLGQVKCRIYNLHFLNHMYCASPVAYILRSDSIDTVRDRHRLLQDLHQYALGIVYILQLCSIVKW